MKKAKQYCLKYGIMDIYLEKIGGEGMSFLYTEYNYEDELRVTRDEALEEGRAEERLASAKRMKEDRLANAERMKADGVEPAFIAKYTGLTADEIKHL
jgi:predicted transposase YdaD